MRLNHLNLSVADVALTRRFFEEFFGFRCEEIKGKETLAVLRDEKGFALVVSNFDRETPKYPPSFHVGFIRDSLEQVNELHQRFRTAGFEVNPPRKMHGSWVFYIRAPGGFDVEVSCPVPE
jgi:lactoylglutathione lyase